MIAVSPAEFDSIESHPAVRAAKLDCRSVVKGRLPYLKDQGVQFYLDGKKVGQEFYHFYQAVGFAQGWAGCTRHSLRRAKT